MYSHTSHSKVIVTARRKQKAKYQMLVQTMFMVKLTYSMWAATVMSDETQGQTLQLTLFQHPGTGKPSSPCKKKNKMWGENTVRCRAEQYYLATIYTKAVLNYIKKKKLLKILSLYREAKWWSYFGHSGFWK